MLSKGSILVVDDEINLCRILGAKLAKCGFSVVAVHDGQQAVDKVRESHFDLVILDLILPKLDGLSALEQIRRLYPELPVIIMTACPSADSMETAERHGVSAYINKPFDHDNLVELAETTSSVSDGRKSKGLSNGSILFTKDQPIMLEVLNGKTSGIFPSMIDSKDDRILVVIAPVRDGEVVQVAPRTPVRVGLGANDAYYSFNSYVLSLRQGDPTLLVLDKPGVIYRVQRRQYPRINIDTPIHYARIADEDSMPDQLASGRSCDLSAGGTRIIAMEPFEPGDLVYIEAEGAFGVGPITAVAEVVRAKPAESDARYAVAMRFRKLKGSLGRLRVD
jgi:CheY-like chemotaxis protein